MQQEKEQKKNIGSKTEGADRLLLLWKEMVQIWQIIQTLSVVQDMELVKD